MIQAESPSLRQKLSRLDIQTSKGHQIEEGQAQMIQGIDVAAWKILLSHTKIPSLRQTRQGSSAQQLAERPGYTRQTQTLELYDDPISTTEESNFTTRHFISPASSQSDTQSIDTPSAAASASPTLILWSDEPGWECKMSGEGDRGSTVTRSSSVGETLVRANSPGITHDIITSWSFGGRI